MKITTHPGGWKLRQAGVKDGMKKSNSMLLPMGPGELDLSVPTVGVRSLMRAVGIDEKPETTNELYQAICKFLKNKGALLRHIRGIGKDAEEALLIWKEQYEACVEEYLHPTKEELLPEPGWTAPENDPEKIEVPDTKQQLRDLAVATEFPLTTRQDFDSRMKAHLQRPVGVFYEALAEIRQKGTVGCARRLEDIIIALEDWAR